VLLCSSPLSSATLLTRPYDVLGCKSPIYLRTCNCVCGLLQILLMLVYFREDWNSGGLKAPFLLGIIIWTCFAFVPARFFVSKRLVNDQERRPMRPKCALPCLFHCSSACKPVAFTSVGRWPCILSSHQPTALFLEDPHVHAVHLLVNFIVQPSRLGWLQQSTLRCRFLQLRQAVSMQPTAINHHTTTTLSIVRDVPSEARIIPDDYFPDLTMYSSPSWLPVVQAVMQVIDPPKPAVQTLLKNQSGATQVLDGVVHAAGWAMDNTMHHTAVNGSVEQWGGGEDMPPNFHVLPLTDRFHEEHGHGGDAGQEDGRFHTQRLVSLKFDDTPWAQSTQEERTPMSPRRGVRPQRGGASPLRPSLPDRDGDEHDLPQQGTADVLCIGVAKAEQMNTTMKPPNCEASRPPVRFAPPIVAASKQPHVYPLGELETQDSEPSYVLPGSAATPPPAIVAGRPSSSEAAPGAYHHVPARTLGKADMGALPPKQPATPLLPRSRPRVQRPFMSEAPSCSKQPSFPPAPN
jgi:hypothetical protein